MTILYCFGCPRVQNVTNNPSWYSPSLSSCRNARQLPVLLIFTGKISIPTSCIIDSTRCKNHGLVVFPSHSFRCLVQDFACLFSPFIPSCRLLPLSLLKSSTENEGSPPMPISLDIIHDAAGTTCRLQHVSGQLVGLVC